MGSWDCYCAICGGPMAGVAIRSSDHQQGTGSNSQAGTDNAGDSGTNQQAVGAATSGSEVDEEDEWEIDDEEEEGYNPEVLRPEDINWIMDCRVIGFNPDAGGVSKTFLSGPGHYDDYGGMTCDASDEPNCEGVEVQALACYYDFNQGDPVFPFHWDCYQILCRALTGSEDITRIDKDILYSVMRSLSPDYGSMLQLDYNEPGTGLKIPTEQFWEINSGEEFYVSSPSMTSHLSARVRDDLNHAFTLPSLDSRLGGKVKQDPFVTLPPEITDQITSLLDYTSLMALFRASWSLHFIHHNNGKFWKQRLRMDMAWFFELHEYLDSKASSNVANMKATYLWAQMITKPQLRLKGKYIGIANRRRMWGVCRQLADLYLPKISEVNLDVNESVRNHTTSVTTERIY